MIILLQKDNLKERIIITQYTGNCLNHFPAKYEFMVNYLIANSVSLGLGKKMNFKVFPLFLIDLRLCFQ